MPHRVFNYIISNLIIITNIFIVNNKIQNFLVTNMINVQKEFLKFDGI